MRKMKDVWWENEFLVHLKDIIREDIYEEND